MIFPDSSRKWLGGFVKLSTLEPLANSIGKWQGRGGVIVNLLGSLDSFHTAHTALRQPGPVLRGPLSA